MFYINLQLRVFVRTPSSRRLEKKDYPMLLLNTRYHERAHTTQKEIFPSTKKPVNQEQQLKNKLVARVE